jgi:Tfp pilus assembly protein PilE
MKKLNNKGFTIYELLVVILAVFLLSWLALATHNTISVNNRNTERQNRIKKTQTALEQYYSKNGHYPSLKDINSPDFRNTQLQGFDQNNLIDPLSKADSSNVKLSEHPASKVLAYEVTDNNGKSCESDSSLCSKYNLVATYEGKVNKSTVYIRQNID